MLVSLVAFVAVTPSLIPLPAKVVMGSSAFVLRPTTCLVGSSATQSVAKQFQIALSPATGYKLPIVADPGTTMNPIFLNLDTKLGLGSEGYRLKVTEKEIRITAEKNAGLFYGLQTLRQLLPTGIYSRTKVAGQGWTVPVCEIEDSPRYSWRGLHLDVSRHFYSVSFIKEYLDWLAIHKQNVFHWHLTDDGGWRMEVKRYPELTRVGAWRTITESEWNQSEHRFVPKHSGEPVYGGYYTQEQIKDVVRYASERFITVVPEIEMPGHSSEVTTAYPELSCKVAPAIKAEYLKNVKVTEPFIVCGGDPKVREFFENVLTETLSLFPSKFIHIGADEVDKTLWRSCPNCQAQLVKSGLGTVEELQSNFVQHFEKWLSSKGRRLVGWDEILEGGLAPGATVMSWRGIDGGIAAAKSGHDVVMSPTSHCYFDYSYESIPTSKAYEFDPTPEVLNSDEAMFVLGGQANIWTEWLSTEEEVEMMIFPRGCALFEALWTPLARKNFDDFRKRLSTHYKRLDYLGIAFNLEPPSAVEDLVTFKPGVKVYLNPSPAPLATVRYTIDGTEPTLSSPVYNGPISVTKPCVVRAAAFRGSRAKSLTISVSVLDLRPRRLTGVNGGLFRRTLSGTFTKMPPAKAFDGQPSQTIGEIGVGEMGGTDNFAVLFQGFIRIPKSGVYTFWLGSDDGSVMWLNDLMAIDNDGLHGFVEKRLRAKLEAGDYPLGVGMFENGGAESLSLLLEGPDLPKGPIPPAMLYR